MTTDSRPPTDEVTERIRHLRGILADLHGYIEREAHELAEPMIRAAEARARLTIVEATGETQRQRNLAEERLRRLRAPERHFARSQEARDRLAAAFGEPAGALALGYWADRAAAVIEKKESGNA